MPTTQPLPTPADRLLAYVEAHEETTNLPEQITAISWLKEGVDTTAPLLLGDVREAARVLAEAQDVVREHREAQYGVRYPNGETVWVSAPDAVRLLEDGQVVILAHALTQARLDNEARTAVTLPNVVNRGNNGRDLADFIGQAEDIAAAARIDSDDYLRGVKIVRRYITVSVTAPEVLEFLTDEEDDAGETPSP